MLYLIVRSIKRLDQSMLESSATASSMHAEATAIGSAGLGVGYYKSVESNISGSSFNIINEVSYNPYKNLKIK
jgi:hypothetical protein